jgi:hypothetical protein
VKEVMVILSLMGAGHLAIARVTTIVERSPSADGTTYEERFDPKFVGFEVEAPISRNDLTRYAQIYQTTRCCSNDRFYQ